MTKEAPNAQARIRGARVSGFGLAVSLGIWVSGVWVFRHLPDDWNIGMRYVSLLAVLASLPLLLPFALLAEESDSDSGSGYESDPAFRTR